MKLGATPSRRFGTKSFIVIVLLTLCASKAMDQFKWKLEDWPFGFTTYFPAHSQDRFYYGFVLNGAAEPARFGPVSIWENPTNGKMYPLSGAIYGLDVLLHGEIYENIPKDRLNDRLFGAMLISEDLEAFKIILPEERESFLEAVEKALGTPARRSVEKDVPSETLLFDSGQWEYSIVMISKTGALEKVTMEGSINPFRLERKERKLLLRDGSLPSMNQESQKGVAEKGGNDE